MDKNIKNIFKDLNLENIKKLISAGLFHIFGSNFLNNIISFVSAAMIAKILSADDMGSFTGTINYLNYALIFVGFGIASGLLQYTSENIEDKKKKGLFKFALAYSLIFNMCISIFMFAFSYLGPAQDYKRPFIRILAFYPILEGFFQIANTYLRAYKKNKEYSLLLNVNSVSFAVSMIVAAYFFGWEGAVISRYAAHIISLLFFAVKNKGFLKEVFTTESISFDLKKSIVRYSAIICASNMVSSLLTVIDVTLVEQYTNKTALAVYANMTKIPAALSFIPLSVMVFVYPQFASHNNDPEWIKNKMKKLLAALGLLNLLVSLSLIILAPFIIRIVFKSEYLVGIDIFRLLSINYFFLATFRIPAGNILAMLRQVKFNFYISIITGISNIALNFLLIPKYGSIGATYSYMAVVAISSIIMFPYLLWTVKKMHRNSVEIKVS